jgi:hypothetical protein
LLKKRFPVAIRAIKWFPPGSPGNNRTKVPTEIFSLGTLYLTNIPKGT